MLVVAVEVAEAGEEAQAGVHRARADRQAPHVGPHQRRGRHLARAPQQGTGEVEADGAQPGAVERRRMTAGAAADVEHAPGAGPLACTAR